MTDRALLPTLTSLGYLFIFGALVQIQMNGRSLLGPPCALVAVPLLLRLARSSPTVQGRRLLAGSAVATGSAGALAALAWLPGVQVGSFTLPAVPVAAAGVAAYALALSGWTAARTLADSSERYRRAALAFGVVAVVGAIAVLALLALADPGSPRPGSGHQPDVAYGRRIAGIGPGVVSVVVGIAWVTGCAFLRKAAQGFRGSLDQAIGPEPRPGSAAGPNRVPRREPADAPAVPDRG